MSIASVVLLGSIFPDSEKTRRLPTRPPSLSFGAGSTRKVSPSKLELGPEGDHFVESTARLIGRLSAGDSFGKEPTTITLFFASPATSIHFRKFRPAARWLTFRRS